ncbi:helix-turn-helix transcriptional regulator [Acinetobacter sp. 1125_18A]|uniref:helix-turn-helix transcriptional regulator n=1 Tax=Acinetobacter sp. 1125_18A TaxID=2605959 RepID=UPI004057F00E
MSTPLERKRKGLKLTVEQVASSINCSPPNYWRIESGKQQPRKDLLKAIVLFFNEEISEMEILFPEQFADESEFDDLSLQEMGNEN